MHVRDTLAYQLKGLGTVEEVESLFVWQAHVFGDKPYDACVFSLEECRVCLHGSKVYCLQKAEVPIEDFLRSDAYLEVWLLPAQLIQSLITWMYDTVSCRFQNASLAH